MGSLGSADGDGVTRLSDGDIHNFSLGDANGAMRWRSAFGVDGDADRDRGISNPDQFCIKADEVANKNRRDEFNFVHGDGDQLTLGVPLSLDHAGLVDVAKDNAAEDGAHGICVARHHHDANGGLENFGTSHGNCEVIK